MNLLGWHRAIYESPRLKMWIQEREDILLECMKRAFLGAKDIIKYMKDRGWLSFSALISCKKINKKRIVSPEQFEKDFEFCLLYTNESKGYIRVGIVDASLSIMDIYMMTPTLTSNEITPLIYPMEFLAPSNYCKMMEKIMNKIFLLIQYVKNKREYDLDGKVNLNSYVNVDRLLYSNNIKFSVSPITNIKRYDTMKRKLSGKTYIMPFDKVKMIVSLNLDKCITGVYNINALKFQIEQYMLMEKEI